MPLAESLLKVLEAVGEVRAKRRADIADLAGVSDAVAKFAHERLEDADDDRRRMLARLAVLGGAPLSDHNLHAIAGVGDFRPHPGRGGPPQRRRQARAGLHCGHVNRRDIDGDALALEEPLWPARASPPISGSRINTEAERMAFGGGQAIAKRGGICSGAPMRAKTDAPSVSERHAKRGEHRQELMVPGR